jgi:DNA topoisomerase IA
VIYKKAFNPIITALWEIELDKIADGKENYKNFIKKLQQDIKKQIKLKVEVDK